MLAVPGADHGGVDRDADRLAADRLGTPQQVSSAAAIFHDIGGVPEGLRGRPGDLLQGLVGERADDHRGPGAPGPARRRDLSLGVDQRVIGSRREQDRMGPLAAQKPDAGVKAGDVLQDALAEPEPAERLFVPAHRRVRRRRRC